MRSRIRILCAREPLSAHRFSLSFFRLGIPGAAKPSDTASSTLPDARFPPPFFVKIFYKKRALNGVVFRAEKNIFPPVGNIAKLTHFGNALIPILLLPHTPKTSFLTLHFVPLNRKKRAGLA